MKAFRHSFLLIMVHSLACTSGKQGLWCGRKRTSRLIPIQYASGCGRKPLFFFFLCFLVFLFLFFTQQKIFKKSYLSILSPQFLSSVTIIKAWVMLLYALASFLVDHVCQVDDHWPVVFNCLSPNTFGCEFCKDMGMSSSVARKSIQNNDLVPSVLSSCHFNLTNKKYRNRTISMFVK